MKTPNILTLYHGCEQNVHCMSSLNVHRKRRRRMWRLRRVTRINIYRAPVSLICIVICLFVDALRRAELFTLYTSNFFHLLFVQAETNAYKENEQTPIHFHKLTQTCLRRLLFKWQTICLQLGQELVAYVQVSSDVNDYLAPSDALELVT